MIRMIIIVFVVSRRIGLAHYAKLKNCPQVYSKNTVAPKIIGQFNASSEDDNITII